MSEAIALHVNDEIKLQLIGPQDAREFFDLIDSNRAFLKKWLTWLDFMSAPANAEKYIEGRIGLASTKEAFCFLIKFNDKIAGVIHLVDIDLPNRKAMIGYWVGQQFSGRGLAKQATEALVEYAFKELKLNRIEIRCATGNIASQSVPKKLGFATEGTLRDNEWVYDHFEDQIVFSMLATDWQKRD